MGSEVTNFPGNKLEALYPQGRSDKGKPRAIDQETAMGHCISQKGTQRGVLAGTDEGSTP